MKRFSCTVATTAFALVASIGFATVSFATTPVSTTPDVLNRGWKPNIEIAGSGDTSTAVTNMRAMADLQRVVLQNTEFHQQTQQFVDELWASLESFNLNRFYELLPETDGDWRQLRVYGARDGKLYRVGPDAGKIGVDAAGTARAMGDMALQVRAKRLASSGGETHYLLQNSMELGVGQVAWPSVKQATEETLRIVVDGTPEFSSKNERATAQVYRDKVIHMNSALGTEDVDVIAPLWASFPAMWDLLAQLGRIEDVVYHDLSQGYRKMNGTFVLDPELMKRNYPALAKHVVNVDRLLSGSFRLSDSRGELLTAEIDSQTLRGQFQAFVADGRIVPVLGGRVVLDAPPIPEGQPWEFTAHMDGTMSLLGVITNIQNFKARIQYLSQPDGAKLVAQVTEVPDVSVKGNALGVMPTSMIDVVLPKNMDQIIKDFIAVACKGNDGKGIVVGGQFQQAANGNSARLVVKSAFEGLDNFFVRVGMGIVSDRVIPDPQVSVELRKLIFDTQEAFAQDLDGFVQTATQTASL
ncbi:MAG TPA: hypothetical protein VM553_03135 [Dongiaceae bacterium]|nr:hypothetical protein [Dongiaceae bacterium]